LTGLIADRLGKKRPPIPVKSWMMGLTWRLATFFSYLTGKPTALTRQAATSAFSTTRYANDAILQVIPEPFRSAKDAVENTVEFAEFNKIL
jgi:dihydroflavonol-4-reductase